MKRLKVLLSAYACRPNMGSEPGVGWNTALELSKYHDIWVLTRKDNQFFIENELAANSINGLNFIYCDLPGSKFWKHGLQSVHFHYYFWQIIVYLKAKKLHSEIGFNVAHHITYVRHSTPSFLVFLPIPFIWGPVGGGESLPKSFWNNFDWYGKVYEILRYVTRWVGERDPFVRITAQKSAIVKATTKDTAKSLEQLGAKNIQIQSQVGLSNEEIRQLSKLAVDSSSSFRFVSIGRLLHWKGFDLGLRAFAKSGLSDRAEYWIIGEGRERNSLQKLSQELNISESVKFFGNLPRQEVLEKLGESHVLVHPSLHESGGFVCLEAMASGRPVICLDLGGPAVQITSEAGYKIAAHTPEQTTNELYQAMTKLYQERILLNTMGSAARKRAVEMFSWSSKAKYIAKLYSQIDLQ